MLKEVGALLLREAIGGAPLLAGRPGHRETARFLVGMPEGYTGEMEGDSGLRRILLAVVLAALVLGLAAILRMRGQEKPAALRTVVLSMRDYTFNGSNPTLSFRVGERVRFVVRNEEATPIRHNFSIPGLNVPCDGELGPGEIKHVTVTLSRPGTFEYLCCTHRGMGGKLVVTRL